MRWLRESATLCENVLLLGGIAVALGITGCGQRDDAEQICAKEEHTQFVSCDGPPHAAEPQCVRAITTTPDAATAGIRAVTVPVEAVSSYEHLLGTLSTQGVHQLTLAAMLEVARSSVPYEEARRLAWSFMRVCTQFSDAECVLSTLWSRAQTVNERHEAMVMLGFAAAWHGAAARGIDYLKLIIAEQTARPEPSARHMVGAYQNLATLYAMKQQWQESLYAAQQAIAWWERGQPGRHTCSRAGVESTLVEALANAGHYAEAEQRLVTLIESGAVDRESYAGILRSIRLYRSSPHARDWSHPVITRRY